MAKKIDTLILRIDKNLKIKLSELADKNNKSVAEYVRRLIEEAIKKDKVL